MFEQSILKGATKTRRAWTVMAAFLCQVVGLGVAFLIPLVAVERMPQVRLVPPVPPPRWQRPPAPPGGHVQIVNVVHTTRPGVLIEPAQIPSHVATIVDPPPVDVGPGTGVVGGIDLPGGSGNGVIGGIIAEIARPQPPQAPAVVAPTTTVPEKRPDRIRLGGVVVQGKLIRKVTPIYPPLAIQAHVSGTVRLQAVISRDGHIQELQMLSGPGLLVQAALEAVRQWVYQPTMLNGVSVEVLTTIDVIFSLNR